MAEKPSVLQARLIKANKENAKLHRFIGVVKMKIQDLEKRVSKLDGKPPQGPAR